MPTPNPHPQRPLRLRARLKWYGVLPISLTFVGLVIAMWFWVTAGARPEDRMIAITIMPSPVDMILSLKSIWFEWALARNILRTLFRLLIGFGIGCAISLPLGVLCGSYGPIRHFFSTLNITAKYLPLAALVPLSVAIMQSTDLRMKIGFLSMATVFGLMPAVITAIDEIEDIYFKTAYTLGAGQWTTILKVMIPLALVRIFESLRITLAVGWSYIILTEMLYPGNEGLGAMIFKAQRRAKPEVAFVVILVIALIGLKLDLLMNLVEYFLFPHRRKRK